MEGLALLNEPDSKEVVSVDDKEETSVNSFMVENVTNSDIYNTAISEGIFCFYKLYLPFSFHF